MSWRSYRLICLLAILGLSNLFAQNPNFLQNSSTGINSFSWGSSWWCLKSHHNLRYAESSVCLDYTNSLSHPTYLNAYLSYSQLSGTVPIDIYISTTPQAAYTSCDTSYDHLSWWNNNNANPGYHVGQVTTDYNGTLATFNIESYISTHPATTYYILFDNSANIHDAIVRYAWIGPQNIITKTPEIQNQIKNISINPNPSNGKFNIYFVLDKPEDITITVFDSSAKQVYYENKNKYQGVFNNTIDLSNLANGIYTIKVKAGEKSTTEKLSILK